MTAVKTFSVAVLITAVFRLLGIFDLAAIAAAFFRGSGMAAEPIAGILGILVAVLIWWAIVHLVTTRLPRKSKTNPS